MNMDYLWINIVRALFLISVKIILLGAYPQGSPTTQDACVNLMPRHPNQLIFQNPSAYTIQLSSPVYRYCDPQFPRACQQNAITGFVALQGQGRLFRGFVLQARTPSGGSRAWGRFLLLQPADSKFIQCQNGITLTHTANTDKQIVRFAWIPEPGMREQVQFVATVVQNLRTIYPGVYSQQLRPIGVPRPPIRTTRPPLTTTKLPVTINTTPAIIKTTSSLTTLTKYSTTTTQSSVTISPMTSPPTTNPATTKIITTTEDTANLNGASLKTAGVISFVTSVIAILL